MSTHTNLVDPATGEVVEFDKAAAERRAERITLRLDAIADNYAAVMPMIRDAIEKRDDLALGYRSPGDYVADRFGRSLSNLGIQVRRAVVSELTEAGLSTRAIAPVVGVTNKTVHSDLQARVTSGNTSKSGPFDVATEGEVTPPEDQPVAAGSGVEEPGEEVEPTSPPSAAPSRPVVGIDGKTYARPEPRKPQRRSLVDDARDAGQELRKAVERLERIRDDDRLPRNKEEVAAHLRHHLHRATQVCQDLDQLIN